MAIFSERPARFFLDFAMMAIRVRSLQEINGLNLYSKFTVTGCRAPRGGDFGPTVSQQAEQN